MTQAPRAPSDNELKGMMEPYGLTTVEFLEVLEDRGFPMSRQQFWDHIAPRLLLFDDVAATVVRLH